MKTLNNIFSRRFRPWRTSLSFVIALSVGLCPAAATAQAGDDADAKARKVKKAAKTEKVQKVKKEKKAGQAEKVLITGSRIPETVKPGQRLVTTSPVDIITREQIDRMGAVTVSGVLVRQPSFR